MNVSQQFFDEIHSNILIIMLIWITGIVLSGFAFEAFIKKFVIREIYLIKCMLKFLPVSFAKQSEGIKNFVASIIGQSKWLILLNIIYNVSLAIDGNNKMDPTPQADILKGYCPYDMPKTNHITPDNPQFHSFDLNLAILTKYGRYVFIRHGD